MTLQALQNKLATIRKGAFTKINYATTKNGLTKNTNAVVRFVRYSHIKGVTPTGKTNPNEQWLTSEIVYNSNTQKHYLQVATTTLKSKSTYYNGENEISKEEYEKVNKPSNYKPVVFRIAIENIKTLG